MHSFFFRITNLYLHTFYFSAKIKILIASLLIGNVAYSQVPTGTPGPGVNWRRGGNLAGPGAPNIFGAMWNSPIYTYVLY